MTIAAEHPNTTVERRHRAVPRIRSYHPLGVASLGFLTALLGAWAGIAAFVGPEFNYPFTSTARWDWTASNALLHLWPGVVALVAGLIYMMFAGARSRVSQSLIRLSVLAAMAAGAWLVIGPALWPVFESTPAYVTQSTASMDFWMRLGSSLGPGLLIVAIGGLVFAAVSGRNHIVETTAAAGAAAGTTEGRTLAADRAEVKADRADKPHPQDPQIEPAETTRATGAAGPTDPQAPRNQLP
jgi:hypothetical protein